MLERPDFLGQGRVRQDTLVDLRQRENNEIPRLIALKRLSESETIPERHDFLSMKNPCIAEGSRIALAEGSKFQGSAELRSRRFSQESEEEHHCLHERQEQLL